MIDEAREPLRLSIPLRRTVGVLAALIVAFSVVSFAGQIVAEYVITENQYVDRIASWLDVNAEASIPTWYATVTLMACGVLLAVIAIDARVRGRAYAPHWALLAIGFGLLSLEEVIGVHSQATKVLRSAVSITDGAGYAIVLGLIVLVGLGLLAWVFGRFFLALPRRQRMLFTTGLVIYLVGVFGSDAVGDYLHDAFGEGSLLYIVVLTVEEALEMTGVLLILTGLLDHIDRAVGRIEIGVRQVAPGAVVTTAD
jgi:hypothetical protein